MVANLHYLQYQLILSCKNKVSNNIPRRRSNTVSSENYPL